MQGKTICGALLVTSQNGHSQLYTQAASVELVEANVSNRYRSCEGKGSESMSELVQPWYATLRCPCIQEHAGIPRPSLAHHKAPLEQSESCRLLGPLGYTGQYWKEELPTPEN